MDWAAPDVSAPVAPPSAPTGPGPEPRRPAAVEARRLGPKTASDILDGSFALLRRSPATILGLTAIFVVPAELLGAYVVRNIAAADLSEVLESGDASLLANDQASGGDTWATILSLLPTSLALVFVAAAMTRLVSAWQTGREVSLGELLRGTRHHAWPLLGSWALIKAAEGVGFVVCVLPAVAVMTWFLVAVPAIVAEDLGAVEGMRRSARLVSRRFWPVLGIGILTALVSTFFAYAVQVIPLFVVWATGVDGFGWVVAGLTAAATALLTTPIVAGAAVLTYLDLRVRTEGLDLELDAVDAFPRPA